MTTAREPKIPGSEPPITIEPASVRVVARVGAQIVADTTRALTIREASYPPVHYIPLEDIAAADGELADAVWSYREPYDAVADIAGHVAFYTDRVDVVVGT